MNRFRKSVTALILASLITLQGTEPIFVQAKEIIEDAQKNAEFSRPEALTEEEAGIKDSTSGEQDQPIQSEENGVKIENGKTRIGIIPVDGDYTHSVIKDNAILYNGVYEGADVQYTVLDSSIKEDIVLQQPTDKETYEYELQIPGYQAEIKDNQVYIYPKGKKLKDAKYLLEAPSMEDAAGEISFLIKLELREEDRKTKAIRQDTALT